MSQVAEIKGLNELLKQMTAYPVELVKTVGVAMSASLNVFWENVPPYPQARPESRYRRTGTLGRSLGSDQSGGATSSSPSIYKIKHLGQGDFEGVFGTSLEYAPYVIGDTAQADVHKGRWWQMEDITWRAGKKINDLWNMVGDKLAAFLAMKGTQ